MNIAGLASPEPEPDLLALDEALDRLAARDPIKAELVKLLFFAGLTVPQAADALGLSHAAAKRSWAYARAWLLVEIRGGPTSPEGVARHSDNLLRNLELALARITHCGVSPLRTTP